MDEMRDFKRSEQLLERAEKVIPLASQTFSKSRTQYPVGAAPLFLQRGKGACVWDVDGHEYIDFVSSLAAVTLGYGDPDVDAAVRSQLENGVILSLPHPLETEVAERIVSLVPCAEMVRFGKNGSDATAGAVRAARAFTGRERVAVCGYHGWQDWYIGSTARNKGVPAATRASTHSFAYNDPASLERLFADYPAEFAAVILEPMNFTWPEEDFLQRTVDLAHEHGALAVFDETITGFRFAPGGAQELFGVTPDLACFGKGLANGYPLSAVAGRTDVMREFEEVFFSFTMGGELLSLAAARASIDKLLREDVPRRLAERGEKLLAGVQSRIERHGCGAFLSIGGHPSWTILAFSDGEGVGQYEIRTLYLQELFARGILAIGSHNLSLAHGDAEIDRLLAVYDEIFPVLADAVHNKDVVQRLNCDPLVPLFKVR